MKLVIFGLTVSSSWGNGHATLWRALIASLARRGHRVVFFERDVPYYATSRDLDALPGGTLHLYRDWGEAEPIARRELADADVAMTTSYCPDALAAEVLMHESSVGVRTFYDLDTPVTLERLRAGVSVPYIGADGLRSYDLVLSYTGGEALTQLCEMLGARRAAPLYGSVDPATHRPADPVDVYRCDLSYIGTYAEDRQEGVERLFLEVARRMPDRRFVLAGAQYPPTFPWTSNTYFMWHLAPAEHPAFYASSRATLNVTRRAMAALGYCPSGRLFEAAACGTPIITDAWEGLDAFFSPDEEIIVARSTEDVMEALAMSPERLERIARAARERTLAEHTADARAAQLEALLESAAAGEPADGSGVASEAAVELRMADA